MTPAIIRATVAAMDLPADSKARLIERAIAGDNAARFVVKDATRRQQGGARYGRRTAAWLAG